MAPTPFLFLSSEDVEPKLVEGVVIRHAITRFHPERRSPLEVSFKLVQNKIVSTAAEIKEAMEHLPQRQKVQIARWMQSQVADHLSDDEMMEIAAAGARALDRRKAR